MKTYSGETFAEVYKECLTDLYENPEFESDPRGMPVKENINVSLEIDNPYSSLYENKRRGSQYRYIAAEFVWYFLGRNDVGFISEYAKFWETIQNVDGTVNSAYGSLIFAKHGKELFTQYDWAMRSLVKDKSSRQAVMHFNMPRHQYESNKDFVCTMYGIFHIRNNKLDFTINMRSNDAILGLATDVAFFTVLQQQALSHLQKYYPELEMGKYIHKVDSFHIYERNYKLVEEMIQHDFIPVDAPKVTTNLIHFNGAPSHEINNLMININPKSLQTISEENYNDLMDDGVLEWILRNINEKSTTPSVQLH